MRRSGRPLDPGDGEVAARKAAGLDTGLKGLRVAWVLVVAALLGTLLTTAVVSLREPKDGVAQARALLVDRITRGRAQVASRRADNATGSQRLAAPQSAAPASPDPAPPASLTPHHPAPGARARCGPAPPRPPARAVRRRPQPDHPARPGRR